MEELKALLEEILDENLRNMVISGARTKEGPLKIKIRPVKRRGAVAYQAALWDGKKEFHKNYGREELIPAVLLWMSRDFRQLQADTRLLTASALVSKKGRVTVSRKQRQEAVRGPELSHNRTKKYLLPEGVPVPFLVKLGVMTPEGKVVHAKYDKFRQINRFLEFIEDVCQELPRDREISIIDFGCGKSYLTFAIYYYLHQIRGLDVRITGLDLKEDVIRHCGELAEEFGYEKLRFQIGDIAQYEGEEQVDMVVTLHACDTATDFALAKAVSWKAGVILSVPCCQHELNGQLRCKVLDPVLKYGLLKERMAALITDGLRASMLEEAGYRVQVLEFIDMEHTPKNILIRAVRDGRGRGASPGSLDSCMDFLGVNSTLRALLKTEEASGAPEKNEKEDSQSL